MNRPRRTVLVVVATLAPVAVLGLASGASGKQQAPFAVEPSPGRPAATVEPSAAAPASVTAPRVGMPGRGDVHVVVEVIGMAPRQQVSALGAAPVVEREAVLFRVVQGDKYLHAGDTLTVTRTASVDGQAFLADGGGYRFNHRYRLWLDYDSASGTYLLTHPSNRVALR
jgi:hypothetical protein